jgi:hypothetical protein
MDLMKKSGCWKLKEESLDRSVENLTLVEGKALLQDRPRDRSFVSVELGPSHWRKNRLKVFEKGVRKRIFLAVLEEKQEVTESCIVRSFIICLFWEITLGS